MTHALVVGGTGMLRGVSLDLARRHDVVSVVARRWPPLQQLGGSMPAAAGRIHPVAVDYHDAVRFEAALRDAAARFGPVELAVCWIHNTAPDAARIVARVVGSGPEPCRFFHVLGSAAADPAQRDVERRERIEAEGRILYREVILGFVIEPWGSRWLTHEETSVGVLEAIAEDRPRSVVGTVEPWSARPY